MELELRKGLYLILYLLFSGPKNWDHNCFSDTLSTQSQFFEISKQLVLHFDAKV